MKSKINTLSVIAVACLAATSQMAHATEVFRLEGYGPISRAMGGTATAFNVGAAGMMANPATLSLMAPGSEFYLGLDLISTDIKVTNQVTGESISSNTHSSNRGPYLAPELAFTHRNGELTLGVGAFAQGGLGTEYGNSSFLSRAAGGLNTGLENSSRLLVLNIPFVASYQVNDKLTVGGSIDAMWQGLNLNLLLGAGQVGSLIGSGRVQGSLLPVLGGLPDMRGAHFSMTKNEPLASGVESWGFGGRIGMTYKVSNETMFGLDYAMESQMNDMEGRATLTAIDGIAGQIPLQGAIKLRNFQMPAKLDLGLSHRFNDQWMMAVDVSQVFWEHAMKDISVGFVTDSGQTLDIQLPQNYKDQTILAFGVAYQTGNWTLRSGARLATQALRSETLLAVIPATPRKHISAGFSYAFSKDDSVDFAYFHAFEESMSNASLPNTADPIQTTHSQNNATIGYTHRF
ncbi:MAG: aromatic hydrocarbon degradation protein [Rhodoferax sp.]|uniref:OmpP1/FadL family transporter n=1 Tax=Rhodoferax sp. TaxID=50421 RepID=UPI0017F9D242|nr:outer membrane protein transport protein [Rhodoferax sp.]NMM14503.1 aromatic hydrocarbon degradation protein [Rhodoferax sp.]NMM21180.1 aromatic hydrocarbon degradation protein [Rhodoferax sp.]